MDMPTKEGFTEEDEAGETQVYNPSVAERLAALRQEMEEETQAYFRDRSPSSAPVGRCM